MEGGNLSLGWQEEVLGHIYTWDTQSFKVATSREVGKYCCQVDCGVLLVISLQIWFWIINWTYSVTFIRWHGNRTFNFKVLTIILSEDTKNNTPDKLNAFLLVKYHLFKPNWLSAALFFLHFAFLEIYIIWKVEIVKIPSDALRHDRKVEDDLIR